MTPAVGSIIGGRYRLERPLASGAMGVVWVARHEQLGQRVAVKLMTPLAASSSAGRARFEREARACAELVSPHVVRVFDYGLEGDAPFLVMELLDGEDLARRLTRVRRLSLPEAAKLAVEIGRGLRRAHEAGLVHRDVKPQNVFLARVDGEEVAKLLDFGVAKLLDPGGDGVEATETGALLGSAHYMSPEQVRHASEVDLRTDLWALAAVLFRALTGKPPFAGTQLGDVIVRICTEPVPRILDVAPELGPHVDAFFQRALAKAPGDRFQSARELADAFVAAVDAPGVGAPIGPTLGSFSHDGAGPRDAAAAFAPAFAPAIATQPSPGVAAPPPPPPAPPAPPAPPPPAPPAPAVPAQTADTPSAAAPSRLETLASPALPAPPPPPPVLPTLASGEAPTLPELLGARPGRAAAPRRAALAVAVAVVVVAGLAIAGAVAATSNGAPIAVEPIAPTAPAAPTVAAEPTPAAPATTAPLVTPASAEPPAPSASAPVAATSPSPAARAKAPAKRGKVNAVLGF